jgi:type IV secretory pathway TraG/TraD family ATPase VirD4
MKSNEDHSLKAMLISCLAGLAAGLVTTVGLNFFIRRLGLAWRGNVFGDEAFNWKDAGFIFLSLGGFFLGLISTKLYFDYRFRRSRIRNSERQ